MRIIASIVLATILASGAVPADRWDEVVLDDMQARAEQGDPSSQTELGFMYYNGFGVVRDEARALEWYGKAAETGFVLALLGLADIYADPQGAHGNRARAIMMYRLAAMQGIGVARNREGKLRESADAKVVAEAERLIDAWRKDPVDRPYRMPPPATR
jgi:TPR repeat protein